MAVTFIVKFNEHLSAEEVSKLSGILLSGGIAKDHPDGFSVEVHRARRVQLAAQTLNNWVACGWVSSWLSEPLLSKV